MLARGQRRSQRRALGQARRSLSRRPHKGQTVKGRYRLAGSLATLTSILIISGANVLASPPAAAVPITDYDPGFIISDSVMNNYEALSLAQIQQFISIQGSACVPSAGTKCLKDYREVTPTRQATAYCPGVFQGSTASTGDSAAEIIRKAAVACQINPQVLLVILQKEQSLVSTKTGKPASTYEKALGFGCYDYQACKPEYAGFANQVYSAASRLQQYAKEPQKFNHRAGRFNKVLYHPNEALCGSSQVYIQTQATASLYNYTPYQPNKAALDAGSGPGDQCSSYGNRNFFIHFSQWFGDPKSGGPTHSIAKSVVTSLYYDLLGRAPDPSGMATWTNYYLATNSGAALADNLTVSQEYATKRVAKAYREVLKREPEPAGLNNWVAAVTSRAIPVDEVAFLFYLSREFFGQGGGTDAGYVKHMYRIMLGREAAAHEVALWVGVIQNSGQEVATRGVWFSPEAARRRTTSYYREYLGGEPDPAGLAHWASTMLTQGEGAVRAGILGSLQYRDRAISRYP